MTNAIITNGECAAILADNKRLRQELAEAQAAATMWKANVDTLSRELEAARQVADAALHYYDVDDGNVEWDALAFNAFDDAVRAYRANAEPL
jgi:hypothetical protein